MFVSYLVQFDYNKEGENLTDIPNSFKMQLGNFISNIC